MEELLSLKWNNHRSTFLHILSILRDKQLYTDATLACEGRFYSVHRLVLSTCSDYFSAMFDRTVCKNPIIVLKDIKCEDLEALLDYMYLGEVNVRQADLASLIKAAECLRVKGLAVPDDEPPRKGGRSDSSKVRNSESVNSPPAKRKRREVIDEVPDDIRPSSSIPKTSHVKPRLSPIPHGPIKESGQNASPSHLQSSNSLANNISEPVMNNEETPFVKVEVEDSGGGEDIGESEDLSYNLSNDSFKEESETDPGGEIDKDLPEFLEQASGSAFSHSFGSGPYQPDLQNWQGDQGHSGTYSGIGYGPSQSQEGNQNASGENDLGPEGFTAESTAFYISNNNSSELNRRISRSFVRNLTRKFPSYSARGQERTKVESCPFCQKVFHGANSNFILKRHMTIHYGLKPFQCPHCQKAFNQKSNLNIHQVSCKFKINSS